jgi:DNA-binding HxlR family transcriptional regulator
MRSATALKHRVRPSSVRPGRRIVAAGRVEQVRECNCSRTPMLGVLSDVWAFLAIREAYFGARRFATFRGALPVPRRWLSARFKWPARQGIFRRSRYGEGASRVEYRLTQAGLDLSPGFMTHMPFGDPWLTNKKGPPRLVGPFDSFLSELSIALNILADWLSRLIDRGIIRGGESQGLPERCAHRLTEAGKDLYGALAVRMARQDRWLSQGRLPLRLTHVTCGKAFTRTVICAGRREPVAVSSEGRFTRSASDGGATVHLSLCDREGITSPWP